MRELKQFDLIWLEEDWNFTLEMFENFCRTHNIEEVDTSSLSSAYYQMGAVYRILSPTLHYSTAIREHDKVLSGQLQLSACEYYKEGMKLPAEIYADFRNMGLAKFIQKQIEFCERPCFFTSLAPPPRNLENFQMTDFNTYFQLANCVPRGVVLRKNKKLYTDSKIKTRIQKGFRTHYKRSATPSEIKQLVWIYRRWLHVFSFSI